MLEPLIHTLITRGFPEYTLLTILLVPIVTTLIAFFRYIVGWRSLGIYTTVLLTFALFQLAQTPSGTDITSGIIQSLFFMIAVFGVGFPLHTISKDVRLHYISRISIIVTLTTLAVLAAGVLIIQTGVTLLNPNAPLSLVIMIMTLDIFIKNYIRKSTPKTIYYMINTIGVACIIFLIISLRPIQRIVMSYPEISILTLILNFIIGRWTGLRLTEFLRFKDIHISEPHDTEHNQTQE